jgi:hypothetical protein
VTLLDVVVLLALLAVAGLLGRVIGEREHDDEDVGS